MTHNPGRGPGPQPPCRQHLFAALAAVAPEYRHFTTWRIPADLWDAIKADPNLRADWTEGGGFGGHPLTQHLLGQPVTVVRRGLDHVQITLNVDCRRTPS